MGWCLGVSRYFFKVGLKVGLFGVANDGKGTQQTYFIPEGSSPGKGGNATMSLVYSHVFLRGETCGAKRVVLQCDNCFGEC